MVPGCTIRRKRKHKIIAETVTFSMDNAIPEELVTALRRVIVDWGPHCMAKHGTKIVCHIPNNGHT